MILFIHRKDLRTRDLAAFDDIAAQGQPSLHVFVLDPQLFKRDRVHEPSGRFFLQRLADLAAAYRAAGKRLWIVQGDPAAAVSSVLAAHPIRELVYHPEATPYARLRDRAVRAVAEARGVTVRALPDATLIDLGDFQAFAGRTEPYKVFTPFYRKWSEYLHAFAPPVSPITVHDLQTAELAEEVQRAFPVTLVPPQTLQPPETSALAAGPDPHVLLRAFLQDGLAAYPVQRDRFAEAGTSGLSGWLNTGALSIREVYQALLSCDGYEPWRRQLAWRDFYLYQAAFDPNFFRYEREVDLSALSDHHFDAWRRAETGIPIIDAAMTQLNTTGELPNRLRMIVAMFLTKNLLCPFPLGEAYFQYKLADYDNALNRGGWLWSSSLGFDAAPYFRIMNPVTQSQTHDPDGTYIRRWLPHLAHLPAQTIHLPQPHAIVDLKASRARAIDVYRSLLGQSK